MSINQRVKVAFDVDGTLFNEDSQVREWVFAMLLDFVDLGCDVIVWSGSGDWYAKQAVEKLGIVGKVRAAVKNDEEKPDIAFDDVPSFALGKVNIIV